MNQHTQSILDRYVVPKTKSVDSNTLEKMERNLQPEVVRIRAVRESIESMKYINLSEAKRLLFEIEALKENIEKWLD